MLCIERATHLWRHCMYRVTSLAQNSAILLHSLPSRTEQPDMSEIIISLKIALMRFWNRLLWRKTTTAKKKKKVKLYLSIAAQIFLRTATQALHPQRLSPGSDSRLLSQGKHHQNTSSVLTLHTVSQVLHCWRGPFRLCRSYAFIFYSGLSSSCLNRAEFAQVLVLDWKNCCG